MSTQTQYESPATEADPPVPPQLTGLIAEFTTVDEVMSAARRVRAAGYKIWDVHSPFPIHGIDAVIGIRPTILPWIVLGGGLSGLCGALLLQWYCNAYDYKFIISGKPFFSLPANIPIIFEGTVLLAALTAVFGMFGLNRLPLHYNPLFKSKRFRRVTDDRFFIYIDASDGRFDEKGTAEFLSSLGAAAVERVED
jgi:ActD protein